MALSLSASGGTQVRISVQSKLKMKDYLTKALDRSISRTDFIQKLDWVDYAYFRYNDALKKNDKDGIDNWGSKAAGAVFQQDVVNPVVISQVDSMVAYFAEVFLSGYPIFPVVSDPANKDQAEALEGMIQDHLTLSQSIPELQLLLKDAGKYNIYACEVGWDPVKTYQPYLDVADFTADATKQKVDIKHINGLHHLDLRNFHFDNRVEFHKLDSDGDYAGYTKIITRVKLKDHLNYLSNEGTLISPEAVNLALSSALEYGDYTDKPVVSDWLSSSKLRGATDWDSFGGWTPNQTDSVKKVPENSSSTYLLHRFYVRLIPSDFGIVMPNRNSVQIFEVEMINRQAIIKMVPYTGAMGRLGIITGYAIEDGFEFQTQSYAEMAIPVQTATTRLFNARFLSANRAIADRGLYNPDMIRSSDINNPNPSAKIPVRANGLQENAMQAAYYPIPFNYGGTEGLLQDAMLINNWSSDLSGVNKAQQGQFTKGNRTMAEFQSINSASENRQRLPAMVLEYRCFQKIKDQMKLNILQFGQDTVITSPRNNKTLEVNIEELQKANLMFEVADGYTPKSKMANTEFLGTIINLIGTSPVLQQQMGQQLPGMLSHLATLGGLRGFSQYTDLAVQAYQDNTQMLMNIQQVQQQLMAQMQQQQAAQGQPPAEGQAQQGDPNAPVAQ